MLGVDYKLIMFPIAYTVVYFFGDFLLGDFEGEFYLDPFVWYKSSSLNIDEGIFLEGDPDCSKAFL